MAQPKLYEDRPTRASRQGMKAICLRVRSGPEAFAYEETPQPRPTEGEVLVRIHAAGVMHTELGWDQTWTTNTGGRARGRLFSVMNFRV